MISQRQAVVIPLTQHDLMPEDRAEVEGFAFFLSVAGRVGASKEEAPYRHLALAWLDGLITAEEGERIRDGRQVWQEFPEGRQQ